MKSLSNEQSKLISKTLKEFPHGTELAISTIKDNQKKYQGYRVVNNKNKTVINAESFFEIGSITKIFTAAILVDVLEKHGISMDAEINPFIDVPLNNNESITFKSLANHTSGLPDYPPIIDFNENTENPFVTFRKSHFLNYISNELVTDNKTKGKWSYSNIGVAILGYALCLIERKNFRELLDQHILSKYDMPFSTCDRKSITGVLVGGRNSHGQPVPPWDFGEMDEPTGAVLSNVKELSNFVLANFNDNDKTLKKVRTRTLEREEVFDVALNCGILKSNNCHFVAGGTRGHRSMLMLDENKKKGVVILSNLSTYHKNSKLINELAVELIDTI